jgi:hypothetical protein
MTSESFSFIDQASGRACVLRVETNGADWPTGKVLHGECETLADVVPEQDAFYCPTCSYSGRISGEWYVQLLRCLAQTV